MLDNVFTSNPWIWAGLAGGLAAIPPLIHLIQLLQHRRVPWAAMEFLLRSHRRNKNWIRLKQWLLLAARISLLLGSLILLSNLSCDRNQWARLLGGIRTHHYVLWDDSLSMSQQADRQTVADRAAQVIRLVSSRAEGRANQHLTLLRCSAARVAELAQGVDSESARSLPILDLDAVPVVDSFSQRLDSILGRPAESFLHLPLTSGLQFLLNKIESRPGENAIVYLVGDFRQADLDRASDWPEKLDQLSSAGARIELIRCGETPNLNLGLVDLRAEGTVRAAGTPFMLNLGVHNYGPSTARNVQVNLRSAPAEGQPFDSKTAEGLPELLIESIAPGQTALRRFPVFFPAAGSYAVRAQLPEDALAGDNSFWQVLEIEPVCRVLVIAPAEENPAALLLGLNPGRLTGIEAEVRSLAYLRDAPPAELHDYHSIFLVNQGGFDAPTIAQLERYCQAGGGVVFFLGPQVNAELYNRQLFRDGQGLFPVRLDRIVELTPRAENELADIQTVAEHPLAQRLSQTSGRLLEFVELERFFQGHLPAESSPGETTIGLASIAVTARGNPQWPICVTRQFGRGSVAAVLTTADSQWNNWQNNPTFPAFILETQNFVGRDESDLERNFAGRDLRITISGLSRRNAGGKRSPASSAAEASPDTLPAAPLATERPIQIDWKLPTLDGEPPELATTQSQVSPNGRIEAELKWWTLAGWPQVSFPGVGYLEFRPADGGAKRQAFAIHVDPQESQLALASVANLTGGLQVAKPQITTWDHFQPDPNLGNGSALTPWILIGLALLLGIEQLLAYFNSYHASTKGDRRVVA